MLIVVFIRQEFVFVPQLQNLEIIGDDAKIHLLEKFQNIRWISYFFVPLSIVLRLLLVSLCFFIGSFLIPGMSGFTFSEWFTISMKAHVIWVINNISYCIESVQSSSLQSVVINKYTSLLFLTGDNNIEKWISLPLVSINIFEIVYWIFLAILVSKLAGTKVSTSFRFVMSSYGVGFMFYIVLLMFLMLYFG